MFNYGYNAGASYAAGVINSLASSIDAFRQLANGRSTLGIESEPKDHTSPLYGITKWGGNLVDTYAGGIFANLGTARSAAGAMAGALVPSFSGGAGMAAGTGMSGGQTVNYNLHVNGVKKQVSSEEEMVRELKALSKIGNGEQPR